MEITEVDVHLLELPLTEPFVAAHGTTTVRTVSVVRVAGPTGEGWGECSALPAATYTAESAAAAFATLADDLGPALLVDPAVVGPGPANEPVHPALALADDRPMARSAMEMALLDMGLRASGIPLARWLIHDLDGEMPARLPAGVAVGLGTVEETVAAVRRLAVEGYTRCKLKIQPGHDVEVVRAVVAAAPDMAVHADANGAYDSTVADRVELMMAVAAAGATSLEQPFPAADHAATAGLIEALNEAGTDAVVVADEAVASTDDLDRQLSAGALSGLSIKPGRVGGLTVARVLHDRCRADGLVATAGGMLETGLGRHALAALAALPGFSLTGDLSPAARWLAADPWPDLVMADGAIEVPTGPGVAGHPDRDLLDRYTVERVRVRGSRDGTSAPLHHRRVPLATATATATDTVTATDTDRLDRLILLHGFTQNIDCWGSLADRLAQRRPLCLVDMPGHGRSGHDGADLNRAADLAVEVGGPGVYLGYSMGGRVALHAALRHPGQVRGLVLIGATAGLDDADDRADRREADEALATRLETDGLPAFLDRWLALPLFAGLGDEASAKASRLRNRAGGLAASLRHCGTGTQEPLWNRLGEIQVPVLVIAGGDDHKFTAIGERVVGALTATSTALVTIPGTHAVHLEEPAATAAAIVEHLDRTATR